MEEKQYIETVTEIVDAISPILKDSRECIAGHDKKCLEKAEKKRRSVLLSSLPMTEELVGKKQKTEFDIHYLNLLPTLQKLAIDIDGLLNASRRKIETDTFFTEKAHKEIKDLLGATEELAKDTKDVFVTKNLHLKQQVQADVTKITRMVNDFALEHQERLIVGLCSPKASYLYLDIIESVKRLARGLASIAERAE
jgi:Na+/phosphate symporter